MYQGRREHDDLRRIAALAALVRSIEDREPGREGHSERVASYAVAIGLHVELDERDLVDLHYAAQFHDIGKIFLPDRILRKEGPLTAEEYAQVQSHPRLAATLLSPIPALRPAALLIAHHHERWDGCGYPYGLRGAFIPLGSRILAVADTFDALTSGPRRGPLLPPERALRMLPLLAGSQLDPDLVAGFTALMNQAPPWSRVVDESEGETSCFRQRGRQASLTEGME